MSFCKICQEEKESFQMKTKDTCNICAYYKNQEKELKEKIKGAVKL